MAVSNVRQKEHTIPLRGGVMAPVYRVVIHPNEDGVGYWAECPMDNGGAATDGDTIMETQANMFESVALYLKDDYPDITDFFLDFVIADE